LSVSPRQFLQITDPPIAILLKNCGKFLHRLSPEALGSSSVQILMATVYQLEEQKVMIMWEMRTEIRQ
jgi:hypothetical protein